MRVLDLDLDYFMDSVATFIEDSSAERLDEESYGDTVWSEIRIRNFLEGNLKLSKNRRIPGRVVIGYNESLFFWREMIEKGNLITPFEVVHVDSHADLGLGYSSWTYIMNELLQFPVSERPLHNTYVDCFDKVCKESIGDYLLFAIAYRWIDKLTYCANPNGEKNDYLWHTLKDLHENLIWNEPIRNC